MSTNQLHGKTYEDYLKAAFPNSADHGRAPSSNWDIEKEFDKIKNLPTSIKVMKGNRVDSADARKIWSINESYRLLVAQYLQVKDVKKIHILYEFLISLDEHSKLLGDISYSEIEDFHNSLLTYPKGIEAVKAGCSFAKIKKNTLKHRSIMQLNAKVSDSGGVRQRRLQCSINLDKLMFNIKDKTIYQEQDFYRNIGVGFLIKSSAREFNE